MSSKNKVDLAGLDKQFDELPEIFQRRIRRLRRYGKKDWRQEYEPYEMFTCTEAVKIAKALKTPEAVRQWHDKSWEDQRTEVPNVSEGHSGNTFGTAVKLAYWYLKAPERVYWEHAAMAQLAGCKECGCYHGDPVADLALEAEENEAIQNRSEKPKTPQGSRKKA